MKHCRFPGSVLGALPVATAVSAQVVEGEGGSGLDLAIVKHLVRVLGGTVHLASRERGGTLVTLLFPASNPTR